MISQIEAEDEYEDEKGIKVYKKSIKELFDGSRNFKVPYFQRKYIWKKYHWDRFLEDMVKISEGHKDYFMGFLVLKRIKHNSDSLNDLVIDGQQRLTTFLIFAKAMCDFDIANEGKIKFINQKGRFVFEHNHIDSDIFEKILKGKAITEEIEVMYEKNQVLRCYKHFKKEKQTEMLAKVNFDKISSYLSFACMSLAPDDDEQQIFDTMNSLNVQLEVPELLKNSLFSKRDIPFYKKTWEEIFEKDQKAVNYWNYETINVKQHRTHLELLLQSFLLIKEAEHIEKGYKKVGDLFRNYKDILDEHYIEESRKKDFINELIKYAKLYQKHIQPNLIGTTFNNSSSIIQRLNLIIFSLGIISVIPFIIFILKKYENNKKEQKKIFELLETYLMRRAIVGGDAGTGRNYNNFFISLMRDKESFSQTASYERFHGSIYNFDGPTTDMPNDSKLTQAFENGTFTNKKAKLILYFLELHARSARSTTALYSFKEYQVEHIMPKKWEEHWHNLPKGDIVKQSEIRNSLISSIGNLTLLPPELNISLRNFAWNRKRDGTDEIEGFKDTCGGIKTFSNYLTGKNWNEKTIQKRSQELLALAKGLWSYDR